MIGFVHMAEYQSRRVPNLGRERAIAIEEFVTEGDVGPGSTHTRQGKPHRVRAESIANLERVHDIALGFRHFLPIRIANDPGDIHRPKWNVIHELQAEHHHASDPEENDVVCRLLLEKKKKKHKKQKQHRKQKIARKHKYVHKHDTEMRAIQVTPSRDTQTASATTFAE